MINAEKQRLRAEAVKTLKALTCEERSCGSEKIRQALELWNPWAEKGTICAYAALASEPDVLSPWPVGKTILLPRVDGDHLVLHEVSGVEKLERGAFGVLEPAYDCPVRETGADLILVPGLAFDRDGRRLGRGKGYYDRLLECFEGVRVGVCFEEQVINAVPADPHDQRMDFLVTPGGVMACGT